MINIGIIDDHQLFSEGLKSLIETMENFQVVCTADNGNDFFELLEQHDAPEIVILDLMMPAMNGFSTGKRLRKELPNSKIIVCSMHTDEMVRQQLAEFQPEGILTKSLSAAEFEDALQVVASGKEYTAFDREKNGHPRSPKIESNLEKLLQLTQREKEIIHRLKLGFSSKMIATQLFISPNTVNNHKANIYEKLGINNVSQLINFANTVGI